LCGIICIHVTGKIIKYYVHLQYGNFYSIYHICNPSTSVSRATIVNHSWLAVPDKVYNVQTRFVIERFDC
jgi:hypothetical protein